MISFSKRNGYNQDDIQYEYASDKLKQRILARFFKEEYVYENPPLLDHYSSGIENVMIEMLSLIHI